MMPPGGCLFCNFEPRYILAENAQAFATYFPRAIKRGHLVVAVKEHHPTFTDLSDDEARSVMSLGLSITKIAQQLVGAEKYYIAAIGDMDHHFHIHLLPKKSTDPPLGRHIMSETGWKGEVAEEVSPADVEEFSQEIRKQL